jgi:hypothetical protein
MSTYTASLWVSALPVVSGMADGSTGRNPYLVAYPAGAAVAVRLGEYLTGSGQNATGGCPTLLLHARVLVCILMHAGYSPHSDGNSRTTGRSRMMGVVQGPQSESAIVPDKPCVGVDDQGSCWMLPSPT